MRLCTLLPCLTLKILSSEGLMSKVKSLEGWLVFSARMEISGLFSKRKSATLLFHEKNWLPKPVYVAPTSSLVSPSWLLSSSPTVEALGWLAATFSMLGTTLRGGKATARRVMFPKARRSQSPWWTEPQASSSP
ncbi:hypothetical protein GDO81_023102 [Engystomops pustulosus]|uniref:Secreted protein n=1 Tax=Engystomops pustulosus TaxID=76066 RepID=A0AAV6Z7H1_ENGPU|nr:hypothetical protein GDO81_023102 [Engystomops pustulosus]